MNKKKNSLSHDVYEQHQVFYMNLAKQLLADFGNKSPSINQLVRFHNILSRTSVERFIAVDTRLNQKERTILYFSAQGQTTEEIANFVKLGTRQVERHRSSILKKLRCRNIAEAVMKGVRFLEIPANWEMKE